MAPAVRRRHWSERLGRLARLRLVIPVLRGRHDPEYTARGTAIGLLVAMTPTIGIQMMIVAAVWAVVKPIRPAWSFNLVVALAWTWVTNVLTAAPIYYLFLVTGRLLMGKWDGLTGYAEFENRLLLIGLGEASWLHQLWATAVGLIQVWGVPMLVGSVPWAMLTAWLGYRWSLVVIRTFRARKAQRAMRRNRPTAAER